MHAFASTLAIAALAAAPAFAAVTPTAPGPGTTCNAGSPCTAEWDLDTTGQWTDVTLDLMTGSNFQMVKLQTLTTLDGTKAPGTFTFTTPQVDPYSAIYFLQWSRNGQDPQWATRFTIADASGNSVTPPNATQPGGARIPWGVGRLLSGGGAASASSSTTPTPVNNATTISVTSLGSASALTSVPSSGSGSAAATSSASSSDSASAAESSSATGQRSSSNTGSTTGAASRSFTTVIGTVASIGFVSAVMAVLA